MNLYEEIKSNLDESTTDSVTVLYQCKECGKRFEDQVDANLVSDIEDDINSKGECDPFDYNLPAHCDWCGSEDTRIKKVLNN